MNKILNDYYNEYLELVPDLGSFQQLNQFNNRFFNKSNYNYNFEKLYTKYLKKIKNYNHIYAKTFKFYLKKELELSSFNNYYPIDPNNNHLLYYMNVCKGNSYQPLKTKEDFLDFMNKTNEYCNYLNICIDGLYELHSQNITLPKIACELLIKQIDEILDNKYYLPEVPIPQSIKDYYLKYMNHTFRNKIIELNNFLKNDYLKLCRNSIGICDTPNGNLYYKKLIEYTTSFDITPKEIHNLGLNEVERIHNELNNFIDIYFPEKQNLSLSQFLDYMRNKKEHKFKSKKQLLNNIKEKEKILKENYKRYFDERLNYKIVINEVPKHLQDHSPVAYVEMASYNLKKPSIYYINTGMYSKISDYNTLSLSLHESTPGHFFQLTYHIKQRIPAFMLYCYNNISYIEGWALYSESLYPYENKYEVYGKLNHELMRSIRLVLDTGINCFNWSYDKAFKYYKDNSSLSDKEIKNELMRYICNPTQAINYKIGEIFFKKYVAKFDDTRKAHSEILKYGPVPLCLLDNTIFKCVKNKKRKTKKKLKKKYKKNKSKRR